MTGSRQDLRDLTRQLMVREPDEILALRTGAVPLRPGSYGQWFTTWDLANGILRDYSMNLYQLVRMAADEQLSTASVMTVMRTWDPIYSTYLGYSGFPVLQRHAERVAQSPSAADRATLVAELSELVEYANRLTSWSHHWFPWSLGEHYRYPGGRADPPLAPGPDVVAARSDPSRRVPVRLTWEPLGIQVRAALACDLNEGLCADVLAALPFTVLQDHAVVSGESMYAWAPLVSIADAAVTERICDAPPGRLRFSQATGNKLVIQYGPTTEPLRVPVLGTVDPGDLDVLGKVGGAVWDSTFRTKELIWLTAELGRLRRGERPGTRRRRPP